METVAALTTLEKSHAPQPCSVIGLSGRTLQVKLPQPVGIGSAVKVEADDSLSLGEVALCRPEGEGYVVWVNLVETLHNVAELTRLAQALVS